MKNSTCRRKTSSLHTPEIAPAFQPLSIATDFS
nr:MAG TPA: hypothetical protein [Caudoviricetes sp.]